MSGAYALHLFCDAIAGGIAWLHPWRANIVGSYLVPSRYWLPLDLAAATASILLASLLRRTRQSRPHPVDTKAASAVTSTSDSAGAAPVPVVPPNTSD